MQSSRSEATEETNCKHMKTLLYATGVMVLLIGVGILWVSQVEGWSFVDSLYWAVQTCSSVGYGEFMFVTVVHYCRVNRLLRRGL